MKNFRPYAGFVLLGLGACIIALVARGDESTAEDPPAGMVQPRYAEDGKLLIPENYRNWIFVGASIGLSYNEETRNESNGPGLFHHTYMQPEAFARYRETGKFPEKTMLILELYRSVQKVAPNKDGYSQSDRVAVEVALKDHSKFEEGWAYFNFPLKDKRPASEAKAAPKKFCYECHLAHAAEDNVFTQFYPVLREARDAREAAAAPSQKQ